LKHLLNTLDNATIVNESLIDDSVETLCNIFNTAGKHFLKENKMCYNKETPMGRWYDHTCKEKKYIFEEYRRKFFLTRSDYDRINMCKSKNDYRKI
jgi:hypothetical protein